MAGRDLSAELFGPQAGKQSSAGRDLSTELFGPSSSGANGIPLPSGVQQRIASTIPDEQPSLWDKIRGVGETAAALGTGATTGALGYIGGGLGGVVGSIVNGDFGTNKGTRLAKQAAEDSAARYTYTPTSKMGQADLGKVSDFLDSTGVQGLPIGPEMNAMARGIRPSMPQISNALSTDAFAAKQLGRKVSATSILPKIDPSRAALLQKAIDAGFTVTPDMMTDNKFVKIIGDTLGKVPLSGSPADANSALFNNKLIGAIGGNGTTNKLTPDVFQAAMDKSGSTIGDIAAKTPVPFDENTSSMLAKNVDNANAFHTDDVSKIVNSYANQIADHAQQNGGVIDGTFMRRINSQLGRQARSTTNGDLKSALDGLHDDLLGAMQQYIADPADTAAFNTARQQYAIGKTIEPLVAKSVNGDISPASLMSRVTSTSAGKTAMAQGNAGDLGDLARIGQLLKEPGSSNTAERGLMYGLLGGGAVASPLVTGGVYAGANAYNRLSPLLANRIVGNSMAKKVPQVIFPQDPMALLSPSEYPNPSVQPGKVPYSGLLSLAEDGPAPLPNSGVPDNQRLATTHDYPTVDFPLRQEVLQQPEISSSIDAFRTQAAQLEKVANNAISPAVRAKAQIDLMKLRQDFAEGMKQMGISDAADAHGLNRLLYQTGAGTRLPIQSTFVPGK